MVSEIPRPFEVPNDLAELVHHVFEHEGVGGIWSVAVALVDDGRLRELHRDFMGIDSETDVMTFPHGIGPDGIRSGDIVVSVDRAAEQALAYGHDVVDEVRFLVVHGALHLCGWNDDTEETRRGMLDRQGELIRSFGERG
jgi:rRNA maturation RNase YbeY